MEFIVFVLFFGFGFIVMSNLLMWALPILFENVNQDPRCEGMHKWGEDDKGNLRCQICKYRALSDE